MQTRVSPRRPIASRLLALMAAGLVAPAALAQVPSFTLVGMAPGTAASRVYGLSADGRTAAGYSQEETSGTTHYPGFRWSADSGRNDFGVGLAPFLTLGYGISGDGTTIVGGAQNTELSGSTAFRWTESGGFVSMGLLAGSSQSVARDASHNGSVIVGTASNGPGSGTQAFRWTESGGMQGLGGGTEALAVSGDGNTVVGILGTGPQAFYWTQAQGMQMLPMLDATGSSRATGVNSNGSIIVGRSGVGGGRATMWINGVPTDLSGGVTSAVLSPGSVSDNGSVVAGQLNLGSGGLFAGVWTQQTGMTKLSDFLTANGVTIPAGLNLFTCTAISADGMTFAGYTRATVDNPQVQGFIATIPTPGTLAALGLAGVVATRRRRD